MNLTFYSFFNESGVAQGTRDWIYALSEKHNISISNISNNEPNWTLFKDRSKFQNNKILETMFMSVLPDQQNRIDFKGKKTIGAAIFESTSPPKYWKDILSKNDVVVSPSTFCQKAFNSIGVNPILFPHTIDLNLYKESQNKLFSKDRPVIGFLGTCRERKGVFNLVRAFNEVFSENEAILYLKIDNASQLFDVIPKIRKQKNIIIDLKRYNEIQIAELMKSFDLFVLPTMGEGFSIPTLQSMALGVPILVTNWSGHTDFCKDNNSWLIEPDEISFLKTLDGYPQFFNCEWAKIKQTTLQDALKRVFNLLGSDEVKSKIKNGLQEVKKYDYKACLENFELIEKNL